MSDNVEIPTYPCCGNCSAFKPNEGTDTGTCRRMPPQIFQEDRREAQPPTPGAGNYRYLSIQPTTKVDGWCSGHTDEG